MAASQPRRAGVRRLLQVLPVAVTTAVGTIMLGPVLSGQRPVELTGATIATSTPAPSSALVPSATPSSAPSATSTPTPSASPSPTANLGPAPSSSTAPGASPGGIPSATPATSSKPGPGATASPPNATPAPIPANLGLSFATEIALQSRLDVLREHYGIPGISVAIVMPDGSTWQGVSGYADVEAGRPVTATTSFAIASISKTFTSALILSLAEEGRINLDAPVRTYLPKLRKVGPRVTVRQLLDHTSGLRDFFFHASIDHALLADPDRRWNATEALRYVGKAYFKLGAGWHYSNTNYLVLGLLAEAVGHKPLGEQIRTRFLEPLALDRTWYQPTERARDDVAHGYRFTSTSRSATPIDLSDDTSIVPFTSVVTAAGGAGGVASDALDLARWARALYGGGLLSPVTLARMTDVSATVGYKSRVPYGLGVQAIVIDGRPTLGHSGRLLGFRSVVRYLPQGGVSIAVLTNQSRVDPTPILRSLLKIALTSKPPCYCADHP